MSFLLRSLLGRSLETQPSGPRPPVSPSLSNTIERQEKELEGIYTTYANFTGPLLLGRVVERMLGFQTKIHDSLGQAQTYVTGHEEDTNPLIAKEVVALKALLSSDIESRVASLVAETIDRMSQDPTPPSSFSHFFTYGTGSGSVQTSPAVTGASGLHNASANCWANALLQTVSFVPSLETAYREFAAYQRDHGRTTEDKTHGTVMLRELDAFKTDQTANRVVSTADTQNVRLAFHHFFGRPGDVRSGIREVFSASVSAHEDAHEALMCLMDGHERIRKTQAQPLSALLVPLDTIRTFRPTGKTSEPDAAVLERTRREPTARNTYSILREDHSCLERSMECQVFLDPQNRSHLSFDELFRDYFRDLHVSANDTAQYLEADDRLHEYAHASLQRQYTAAPNEFVLTIKRFGWDLRTGHSIKITDNIPVKRYLSLPEGSIAGSREPANYELDSVIVHSGGTSGGHYKSYQKRGSTWVEMDDSHSRIVPDSEMDRILQQSYIHHYRKIDRIPSDFVILPSIGVEARRLEARIDSLEKQIQALQSFSEALAAGSTASLSSLDVEDKNKLEEAVWLRDGMPHIWEYGKKECARDLRTLLTPCSSFLSSSGENLLEQLIAARRAQLRSLRKQEHVMAVKRLEEALSHPSYPKTELNEWIRHLPVELRNSWDGAVYQHDVIVEGRKRCDVHEYGKKALDANVRTLYEIREGIEGLKTKFASEGENIDALLTLLSSAATKSSALSAALERLPTEVINQLHGLIYHAHVQKFGKEACNKHEYGKKAIAANPRMLSTVRVGSSGRSLVEEEVYAAETALTKAKQQYTKECLEAFLSLMNTPSVSKEQLIRAFERLDVPKETKEKLLSAKWQADGSPEELGYGDRVFYEDPRCLLTTTSPVLAGPPLVEEGTNIIEQMIALIHKDLS